MPTGGPYTARRRGGGGKSKKKKKTRPQKAARTMPWCNHFSFLLSRRTIALVRRSKVLFLMRGMPGSGKSAIVKQLAERYPDAVICSADQYMVNAQGEYGFDRKQLSTAHDKCRTKAIEACLSEQTVIVDNTNLHRHEIAIYLLAAHALSYNMVIVEPRTPWARDVEELAKRNVHGLTAEVLEKKMKGVRPIIGFFYGWFLDAKDTDYVCRAARRSVALLAERASFSSWYEEVVRTSPSDYAPLPGADSAATARTDSAETDRGEPAEVAAESEAVSKATPPEEKVGSKMSSSEQTPNSKSSSAEHMQSSKRSSSSSATAAASTPEDPAVESLKRRLTRIHSHQVDAAGVYKSRAKLLHVTTKYARGGHREEMVEYATSRNVENSLGSASELCVTGFFITPRTMGARIQLSPKQLRLWGKDREFSTATLTDAEESSAIQGDEIACGDVSLSDDEVSDLSDEDTSDEEDGDEVDRFCPSVSDKPGSTAHLTIGFLSGQKAAQTGIDLYDIIKMEREAKSSTSSPVLEEFRIETGTVRHYRGNSWMLYLDRPVRTEGIFTGSYFK